MTCKDCLHDGVCFYQVNTPNITKCPHFKDNSRYIKLPCKVGDTVYVLMKKAMPDYEYKEGVNEITVRHITIRKGGIYVSDFWGFINWKFGERAFLTKEEAERKNDDKR